MERKVAIFLNKFQLIVYGSDTGIRKAREISRRTFTSLECLKKFRKGLEMFDCRVI